MKHCDLIQFYFIFFSLQRGSERFGKLAGIWPSIVLKNKISGDNTFSLSSQVKRFIFSWNCSKIFLYKRIQTRLGVRDLLTFLVRYNDLPFSNLFSFFIRDQTGTVNVNCWGSFAEFYFGSLKVCKTILKNNFLYKLCIRKGKWFRSLLLR